MLEGFLRNGKPPAQHHADIPEPWKSLARLYVANERYLAAAKLFDSGRKVEAGRKLDELLNEEPQYPLGLMLKGFLATD